MTDPVVTGQPPGTPDASGRAPRIRFCSRCGRFRARRSGDLDGLRPERVCPECGMGVILTCPAGAMRSEGGAFLIATGDLRVSAVSEAAERILGREGDLLGRTLPSLLSSGPGDAALRRQVPAAAWGRGEPVAVPVTALGGRASGRDLEAHIAGCGPPRAALIVLEPALRPS